MEFGVLEYNLDPAQTRNVHKGAHSKLGFCFKIFSFMLTKFHPEEHSWEKARAEEPLFLGHTDDHWAPGDGR